MLRRNTTSQQLIKHNKISYSIVSLVFWKFLCSTYLNDLNHHSVTHSLTGWMSSENVFLVANLICDGRNTYQQFQCCHQNNNKSQPGYTMPYQPVSTTLALPSAIRSSICLDPTLWPGWLGKTCQTPKLLPV